ncbi:hypothetical protein EYR36_001873 [Pleurotus pulmonarius]|nr:hypothetical protein EYR36_001873 [Pleurotus pulmonarius]
MSCPRCRPLTSTPPDISHRPPFHAKGASEISAADEKEDVDHRHGHLSDVMGQPFDNKAKDSPSNFPFAQLKIEKGEIEDKSKGDGLAKAIVVIQTAYFLIQLFARVAQRLIITKLEIMTLAYALLCGMLYIFWWHKPYNVQRPISVSIEKFNPHPSPSKGKSGIARIMSGGFILNVHRSVIGDGEGLEVLEISGDFELSMNVNLHRLATISSFLTATAFGGVHCIAWNFEFTTPVERLIWNISAALVTTIPLVWISMVILGYSVDRLKRWCGKCWAQQCVHILGDFSSRGLCASEGPPPGS